MDLKGLFEKITGGIKKYRYAILVLVIGLVLMAIPNRGQNTTNTASEPPTEAVSDETLEDKLITVLSQVKGAGEVQVILSVATGKETVYQTDDNRNNNGDNINTSTSTVTVTDKERNQLGLVRQENPAIYQGAVIVCRGADDPSVKLALIDAVSKLTGLGANCIAVLKMK